MSASTSSTSAAAANKFDQTSQMSTTPHDPMLSLASNCIRDFFGPTVQLVADGLLFRGTPGGSTLQQLVTTIRAKCRQKVYSQERIRLLGKSTATRLQNQHLQVEPIKAALLVLVQHSIVKVNVSTTTTATATTPAPASTSSKKSGSRKKRSNTSSTSSTHQQYRAKTIYKYEIDLKRARLLPRYPRYVEYVKKALDNMAASLVEELLVQGRLRTMDAIQKTVERVHVEEEEEEEEENDEAEEEGKDDNNNIKQDDGKEAAAEKKKAAYKESIQAVLDGFKRLTQAGFLEQVPTLEKDDDEDHPDLGEFEFEGGGGPPTKKTKIVPEAVSSGVAAAAAANANAKQDDQQDKDIDAENALLEEPEDSTIVELWRKSNTNRRNVVLPRHAVWRVNVEMFHESLRAFILGRLVAERYGHKIQSVGSMITAALKYMAHRRHAAAATVAAAPGGGGGAKENEKSKTKTAAVIPSSDELTFDAASIIRYIPKNVAQALEKKRKAQASQSSSGGAGGGGIGVLGGGAAAIASKNAQTATLVSQVARSLQQLATYTVPVCILEVETGAKPEDSKFEVCTTRMVQFLQQRIATQIISDRHGDVASRVVTILQLNGHLEADSLAEAAMVPAKDIREILHRLYRCKYIDLFTLNQSRTHNPSNMIYLWTASTPRMLRMILQDVCTALLNLRLRRQHQVEIGKNWIERAQEEGDMDENHHEADKLNHRKFCLGLERLYNSCLQLDETLMVIEDF